MARVWSCGFETGTLGHELAGSISGTPVIQSTRVRSGNYAFQCSQPSLMYRESKLGLNLTTCYFRLYIYTAAFPTGSYIGIGGLSNSSDADIFNIRLTGATIAPAGRIQLYNSSSGSDVLLGTGTAVLNLNAWNLLEFKVVIGAGSGIVESKINGVVDQTFTGLTTNARGNIDRLFFGTPVGGYQSNIFFDDMAVDDAAYCGDGKIIARSPVTGGSPTHDNWTKSSGIDAGALWDETPFNATTFCTSSTSGQAQTAVMADFSATQTGHGSETIGASETINACKAAIVAKSGTASSASNIRRRINGVDTDTNITLTTSDAYYETPIFTATPANLDIAEVGAAHGPNTNLHTVEDVWLLVEFSAATLGGTLAATEATDTASFAGDTAVFSGTLAVTEATDTAAFAGNAAAFTGTLAVTEAADIAIFAGSGVILGPLAVTEAADTAAFAGDAAAFVGSLAATETTDAVSFAGDLVELIFTGPLVSLEGPDTAVITAELGFGAVFLDPNLVGPNIFLSNFNLTAIQTTATIGNARANAHQSSGKYYYEFTVDAAGDKQVGICTAALSLVEKLGQNSLVSIGVDDTLGWMGAGGVITAPVLSPGHTYGMAVDIDNGKAFCKDLTIVDGLWNENASSDPVTGVGGALFFVASTPPVITSSTAVSIPENTTAVMTVTATDPG